MWSARWLWRVGMVGNRLDMDIVGSDHSPKVSPATYVNPRLPLQCASATKLIGTAVVSAIDYIVFLFANPAKTIATRKIKVAHNFLRNHCSRWRFLIQDDRPSPPSNVVLTHMSPGARSSPLLIAPGLIPFFPIDVSQVLGGVLIALASPASNAPNAPVRAAPTTEGCRIAALRSRERGFSCFPAQQGPAYPSVWLRVG